MKNGVLFFDNKSGRFDIKFHDGNYYGGLHCGECFDVKINGEYVPTRIELSYDWFLVGTKLKGDELIGKEVMI